MSWAPSHLADRKECQGSVQKWEIFTGRRKQEQGGLSGKEEGWLWQDHPQPRASQVVQQWWRTCQPMPEMEEMRVQPLEDTWIPWRRKSEPIPVFLLNVSHGQRGLAHSFSPWVTKGAAHNWVHLHSSLGDSKDLVLSKVILDWLV